MLRLKVYRQQRTFLRVYNIGISNSREYFKLVTWVLRNLKYDADTNLVKAALQEIRQMDKDLTAEEEIAKIQSALEAMEHGGSAEPWLEVYNAIDWDRIRQKEEMTQRARDELDAAFEQIREAYETIKLAKELGVITVDEERRRLAEIGVIAKQLTERLPSRERQRLLAEIQEKDREIEQLKKKVEELSKKPISSAPKPQDVRRSLTLYIANRVNNEGLTPKDEERLLSLINPNTSYEENKALIDSEIEALKLKKKPEKIEPVTAMLPFPFGRIRFKRVRIPQPIPAICSVVRRFAHFDDARKDALSEKLRDPQGNYGYAFDPEQRNWVKFLCPRMPANADVDKDGLLFLPALERLEREEL